MNIKEYLRSIIKPSSQPNLELVYADLMNLGYTPTEICYEINLVVKENFNKIVEDYQKRKNEDK